MKSTAPNRPAPNLDAQTGVTMIEALVTAIILAVGVLGIVSLLGLSKIAQHETMQRTRAIAIADDILERIRRNPMGIATYDDRGVSSPLGGGSIANEPTPNCATASCTSAEIATYDLWMLEQMMDGARVTYVDQEGSTINATSLRNISACIDFAADTGRLNTGIVDVILQWRGMDMTTDGASGSTVCGTDWADADKPYRRQVVLSTYIIDETEL